MAQHKPVPKPDSFLTKPSVEKTRRLIEAIEAEPELLPVYAESLKLHLQACDETLDYYHEQNQYIRGKAGVTTRRLPGSQRTIRARQMWVRTESWKRKPHTCEGCSGWDTCPGECDDNGRAGV